MVGAVYAARSESPGHRGPLGHAPYGQDLVFGNLRPTQGYVYDPVTGNATETDPPADVECGSMTALQDGRILVVGGHAKGARGINNIMLFDPATLTWASQPSSPMGRYYPTSTLLPNGTVVISGGFDMNGAKNPDVELWTPPETGNWAVEEGRDEPPLGPLPAPVGSALRQGPRGHLELDVHPRSQHLDLDLLHLAEAEAR